MNKPVSNFNSNPSSEGGFSQTPSQQKGKTRVYEFKDGVLELTFDNDLDFVNKMKLVYNKPKPNYIIVEGYIMSNGGLHDVITVTVNHYNYGEKFTYDVEVPVFGQDIWVVGDFNYYEDIFHYDYGCGSDYEECLRNKSIYKLLKEIIDSISPEIKEEEEK
jgi:hypothetical protein